MWDLLQGAASREVGKGGKGANINEEAPSSLLCTKVRGATGGGVLQSGGGGVKASKGSSKKSAQPSPSPD